MYVCMYHKASMRAHQLDFREEYWTIAFSDAWFEIQADKNKAFQHAAKTYLVIEQNANHHVLDRLSTQAELKKQNKKISSIEKETTKENQ